MKLLTARCTNSGLFFHLQPLKKPSVVNCRNFIKRSPSKWIGSGSDSTNIYFCINGSSNRRKTSNYYYNVGRFQNLVPVSSMDSSSSLSSPPALSVSTSDSEEMDTRLKVIGWSAVTLVAAVADRVFHKLALVPMKEYPFFLAQLNAFLYVAVYFFMLRVRHNAGIATDEMLAIPKLPFIVIGFLESVSIVSAMYSGAMLPGPAIPLLYQTFLVWQLVFSYLLLGRRYSFNQILGSFLAGAGVVVAVTSGGSGNGQMLAGVGIVWPALMIASSAFQAGASIVKEFVFVDAGTRLKGKRLDIFVVNSFASAFQVLFMLLFLPILSNLEGIPLFELPSYFTRGAACLLNLGTNTTGCGGAPLLPLFYMISNILFKISYLNLLKLSGAVVASLAVRTSVPIAIYVLSLSLPYLPGDVILSSSFHLGSLILMIGLILYNTPSRPKHNSDVS